MRYAIPRILRCAGPGVCEFLIADSGAHALHILIHTHRHVQGYHQSINLFTVDRQLDHNHKSVITNVFRLSLTFLVDHFSIRWAGRECQGPQASRRAGRSLECELGGTGDGFCGRAGNWLCLRRAAKGASGEVQR